MRTRQPTTTTLEDQRIPVRAKLAAAWTSFMFLYVYVDILAFFRPGVIDDILAGTVYKFDITQTFVTTALTLMAIPILSLRPKAIEPHPAGARDFFRHGKWIRTGTSGTIW